MKLNWWTDLTSFRSIAHFSLIWFYFEENFRVDRLIFCCFKTYIILTACCFYRLLFGSSKFHLLSVTSPITYRDWFVIMMMMIKSPHQKLKRRTFVTHLTIARQQRVNNSTQNDLVDDLRQQLQKMPIFTI